MNISVIQPDIIWEDKSANFRNLHGLLSPLFNKTDIVILPEMFNTGFSMDPEKLCESDSGETIKWMKSIAVEGNFGVCGSFIIRENRVYLNRWFFVTPESDIWYYDKRHLFSMGGEDKLFIAGKSRLIFSFRGVRISPYICYDLRFPVWSRNHNEYDLIIYAANWPDVRRNVWTTLLKARAIENQCYVAGSNRIGTDGAGINYYGDSMIINPRGEIITSAEMPVECSLTAEISMTDLSDFRRKFPVTDDADDFTINI
jgi:omega-amidase